MTSLRLVIGLLCFDIATILCDVVMVIRRFTTFIAIRFILSSISFTLGLMVQIDFYNYVTKQNSNFEDEMATSIFKILVVTIMFILQGYIIWFILNIFMYL